MENYPQWNLPNYAKARLGKGGTWSMQFSPDGTQLALSCPTGVWFYDVKTGKELSLFTGKRGTLTFSPDGRFLAKGGDQFQLWEIATQREVPLKADLPGSNVLRFSNDSKTLVYLGKEGDKIYRLDVETGKNTEIKLQKESTALHLIDCVLTEDKIAIGGRNGSLEVWDTTTGEKLATLRERGKQVDIPNKFTETNRAITLKFSPDGTQLAAGNLDTTIQIWDATSGEELTVLQTSIKDSNMWFLSRGNGKDIVNNPMKEQGNARPSTLAFSPDGSLLACGSEDSTIKLWHTITDELIATFTGHLSNVNHLAFSPDGTSLASGSDGGTVRFWNINTKEALQTCIIGHMWIRTASFLGDGSKLTSVFSNGIITNWDLRSSEKTTLITKAALEEPLYWGAFRGDFVLSPDGLHLANYGIQNNPSELNYRGSILRMTDVNTGHEVATFPHIKADVFSPDGKTAACSGGYTIRLLKMETGETREIIFSDHDEDSDKHKPLVAALVFSPDGQKIVSGTMGGHLQIWDVETGERLSAFFEETPPKGNMYQEVIRSLVYSSDGTLLAVGSTKRLRLIGSAKQTLLKEIVYGPGEYNDTFIFSPDDTILIVGIGGGRIELWDVATGDKLISLDGHSVSLDDISFSPDNKTLMSVGGGNILLWDWDKVLTSARGKEKEITAEQFVFTEAETAENVLQFLEHSQQLSNISLAKTSDHILWKAEVYLANEWFDAALEGFTKYLTAADYPGDRDVTTPPRFHRNLFARIGKIGKVVQDTEGFVNMLNQLLEAFTDSLSIKLQAHLVLAKFYHHKGFVDKSEEHIQTIDSLTVDFTTKSLNFYLSMADYYHDTGNLDKADAYIQKIHDMPAELDSNDPFSLTHQFDTHFKLAEYYRSKSMVEMADEHIRKTGFVTEDAWMVLGPYDNTDGIGYDTAYIPEDITEIDLNAKYDGLDGSVSWKKFTDPEFDGYIHLGEKHVDWQVSYAFATINSPDERDARFRFDSDDQGKVWLNGKAVFTHTKAFMAIVDTYTIPVKLKPGKNSILVKVCNEMGGWGFYLRITDQDGEPFDDLVINRAIQNKE